MHDKFPQVCFRNARRQKTMTAPSDTAILTSVVIEGMRAYAHIGAHRSESAKPQPLQVTLRVTLRELDPETATLRETLDYHTLRQEVRRCIHAKHHVLLENLGSEILSLCLDKPNVRRVLVRLHKTLLSPEGEMCGVEMMQERRTY